VYEFHGNLSVIDGSLNVDPPALLVRNYERSGQWAYVDFESEPFNGLSILTGSDPDHMGPVDYFEVAAGKVYKPQEGLRLKIGLTDSLDRFVALKIKNPDDRESYTLLSPGSIDSLHPEIHFMGDRLVVQLDNTAFPMTLDAGTGRIPFLQTDNGDYQAQVVVPDSQHAPLELAIAAGDHPLWHDTLALARLDPDRSQRFSWFDSSFSIVSQPGAVVEPLALTVNRFQPDMITDSLPYTGWIYELQPQSLLLFKRMDAYIHMDSLAGEDSWSLFRVSDSGYLSYSAKLEKLTADLVRTRIGSPGKYIIACDTIPPDLAISAPKNGSVYNSWPAIRFNLSDIHSGIGSEDDISILLDGEYIMPEWDPEDKLVEAEIHLPLTRGTHTLTISVSDRSNNVAREARIFTIR
jgi:hypothetical protein